MRAIAIAACCLTLITTASAEIIPLAEQGTVLPYGETADYAFTPTGDYQSARLIISIRMDSAATSGSTHVMSLLVNGEGVNGALSRTATRLLNKPLNVVTSGGLNLPWVRGTKWRVCYAPDFEILGATAENGLPVMSHSGYRSVLDITDMTTRDAENTVTIEHLGEAMNLRQYFPDANPSLDFVLDELAIELSDEPSAIASFKPAEVFTPDRLMIQPPATCDVTQAITLAPDGGMSVDLPGMPAQVISRFSWQGGDFNTFGRDEASVVQENWRVEVAGAGPERTVTGTAPEYSIERRLTWAGDHVEIADTFTNTTDADIGLAFSNELRAADENVAEIYLGGNPDPAVVRVARMENSTAFVQGRQAGLGMLAIDDVYRIQGVIYFDQGAGIRSEHFALAAGDSYTVRWSLYPVLRPDYYDFINLCRRDLNVNWTVPGGFQFSLTSVPAMEDADLLAQIKERDLRFLSSGVWFDHNAEIKCYHGGHMLKAADLRESLREACAKLRRVAPDVKSLIYIHCFINTDPEGHELYPDSYVVDKAGELYINPGYTQRIGVPFRYFYPAVGNSYLDAMKQVIDMCLDEDKIGADGIYWDEVEMMSTWQSFEGWDGRSALLGEDHRIETKFTNVHLASLQAKVELVEYIRAKGGELIGNSCARTETLSDLGFLRFVETAAEWYPARAHLYTPISLGDHKVIKDFPTLLDDIRLKLMWGSLYYYYSRPDHPSPTITQHMFPFTPVELHRGWLLGEERILTAVPGTFTLGNDDEVTVYWYGADGALTEKTGEERIEDGKRLIRLALAEDEMAVIERN